MTVCALSAGATPQIGNAGRDSSIILSGYETGVTIASSSDSSLQSIRIDFGPDQPPLPKKFVIEVPAGYTLDLTATPGTRIGDAVISIAGVDEPSIASGFGSLVANDPKALLSDAAVQACAPGLHKAAWKLTTSLAGQQVNVTVLADADTHPGVGYVLQGCPSALTGANTNAAASISLSGLPLRSPAADGDYRWRAFVTPQTRKAYELQAVVPLPESVTLKARYDRKRKTVLLTGTVVEGGEVVPGARVAFTSSREDNDVDFWDARADEHGRFAVKARVTRTTDFTVSVLPSIGPCSGSSVMPGGCIASTTIPPDGAFTTLWISLPGGAVRAIRPADQTRAEREGLVATDLPPDFGAALAGGDDCFNPEHEATLTITGESTSPVFYHLDQDQPSIAEALGLTRVYANAKQARRAFEHQARLATARCEIDKIGSGLPIGPLSLSAPARIRAFRSEVSLEATLSAKVDIVFLQRGRSVTILRFVFVNASEDLEQRVTRAVAGRMR